jgi:hypothetical protein
VKQTIAILVIAFAAAAAAPSATPLAGQANVAELQGRIAGKPQQCIPGEPGILFSTADSDPHLLFYDDGKTVWANSLSPSCGFGPGETVVPDASASYYCSGDFVRQGRRIELSPFGQRCALGKFTPYRTAKTK